MNRSIFCGLVLLAVVFSACAQQKKATKKKTTTTSTTTTTNQQNSNIAVVEIHRGACFGRCPTYTLRLSFDGKAIYNGRKFSTHPGTYEKTVDATRVQEIFKQLERYKVDTCQARYKTIPDMSPLDYAIVYKDGKEVNIENANSPFAPKFLKGLAEEMDRLAPIDDSWKKTASWTDK
jgi:hypothetical protein